MGKLSHLYVCILIDSLKNKKTHSFGSTRLIQVSTKSCFGILNNESQDNTVKRTLGFVGLRVDWADYHSEGDRGHKFKPLVG